MDTEELSIILPKDMARMVRDRVASGAYDSNSDVIRDALRMWQDRDEEQRRRLGVIRDKINEAADDLREITDVELGERFQRRFDQAEGRGPG